MWLSKISYIIFSATWENRKYREQKHKKSPSNPKRKRAPSLEYNHKLRILQKVFFGGVNILWSSWWYRWRTLKGVCGTRSKTRRYNFFHSYIFSWNVLILMFQLILGSVIKDLEFFFIFYIIYWLRIPSIIRLNHNQVYMLRILSIFVSNIYILGNIRKLLIITKSSLKFFIFSLILLKSHVFSTHKKGDSLYLVRKNVKLTQWWFITSGGDISKRNVLLEAFTSTRQRFESHHTHWIVRWLWMTIRSIASERRHFFFFLGEDTNVSFFPKMKIQSSSRKILA